MIMAQSRSEPIQDQTGMGGGIGTHQRQFIRKIPLPPSSFTVCSLMALCITSLAEKAGLAIQTRERG